MGDLINIRGIDEKVEMRQLQAQHGVNHAMATLEAIINGLATSPEAKERACEALETLRRALR